MCIEYIYIYMNFVCNVFFSINDHYKSVYITKMFKSGKVSEWKLILLFKREIGHYCF